MTVRSVELCRLAGITYRQLDHWTRSGLLVPARSASGSGTQRLFTEDEAVIAAILGAWSQTTAGAPFPHAVINAVRERLRRHDLPQTMTFDSAANGAIKVIVDLDVARATLTRRLHGAA